MVGRFIVEGETCFVALLSEQVTNQRIGLIIHGEQAMEQFCKEAISALEELLRNKSRNRRLEHILMADGECAKQNRRTI